MTIVVVVTPDVASDGANLRSAVPKNGPEKSSRVTGDRTSIRTVRVATGPPRPPPSMTRAAIM